MAPLAAEQDRDVPRLGAMRIGTLEGRIRPQRLQRKPGWEGIRGESRLASERRRDSDFGTGRNDRWRGFVEDDGVWQLGGAAARGPVLGVVPGFQVVGEAIRHGAGGNVDPVFVAAGV